MKKKVLLIGHEARAHWLAEAIARSEKLKSLVAYMKQGCNNPGIADLSSAVVFGDYSDAKSIVALARDAKVNYAVISGEEILSHGIVDALEATGVGCVGSRKLAAKIETSKAWTRELIRVYGISGNPNYRIFWTMDVRGMSKFMDEIDEVVVKPDGLTGGGGVMVQGDHFASKGQVMEICRKILKSHSVCKYLVPQAYKRDKFQDSIGAKIEVGKIGRAKIYFASVDDRGDGIYTTTSRSIAVTGVGDTLAKAERIAERGIRGIRGPLFYRPDIGTAKLIKQRVDHVRSLRGE